MRSKFTKLKNKLDETFSRFIRARDRKRFYNCPFCHRNPIECCFHFVSRRHHATRWDEINCVGACKACNRDMSGILCTAHPERYWRWFIDQYGLGEYDNITDKSKLIVKFSSADLQSMVDDYESKTEAILGGGWAGVVGRQSA